MSRSCAEILHFVLFAALSATGASNPGFDIQLSDGGITSLKETGDLNETEFIAPGRRLGDVLVKYPDGQ